MSTMAQRGYDLSASDKFSMKSERIFFESLTDSSKPETLRKITIRILDDDEMLDLNDRRFERWMARKRAGKNVEPHVGLDFYSLDQLRELLTPQRQRIYRALRRTSPESVYELAKILGRDYKGVAADLKVLKDWLLVRFETHVHNGRARSKPVLTHRKLVIEFG